MSVPTPLPEMPQPIKPDTIYLGYILVELRKVAARLEEVLKKAGKPAKPRKSRKKTKAGKVGKVVKLPKDVAPKPGTGEKPAKKEEAVS